MNAHQNARTTPLGRATLVRRVLEEGWTRKAVAEAFGLSERTVGKWLARYRQAALAGLRNRSSAARQVANRLPEPWVDMIVRLRREYRMTGQEIAERLQLPRSTVAGHLTRLGLGRAGGAGAKRAGAALQPRTGRRADPSRHQEARPLHPDRPSAIGTARTARSAGSAVDDASRLAYVEVLPDEKRQATTGFLIRALRWFKSQGIRVERVMTDNGPGYIARLFRKACRLLRLRHIRTRPYTPKTNGKAERFIQTLMREWAYALPYPSSDRRAADLPRWLRLYNHERPHASALTQA